MATANKRKPVQIRGLDLARIQTPGDVSLLELCKFYLVLRALDGDVIARELLDATGTRVHDLNGTLIYPPEDRS